MTLADFVHAVIAGLETAGSWALWWCATTAAVVAVVAGCRATAEITRRLEHYTNQPREEKP